MILYSDIVLTNIKIFKKQLKKKTTAILKMFFINL